MKAPSRKTANLLLYAAVALYAVICAVLLFGKRNVNAAVNLIPFHTIGAFLSGNGAFAMGNVLGNIALFVPMGLYLPLLCRRKGIALNTLRAALASVAVELAQMLLHAGAADVDDVILNALGGLLGVCLYRLFARVFKENTRFAVGLTSLGIGALALALGVCLWTGVFGIYLRIL